MNTFPLPVPQMRIRCSTCINFLMIVVTICLLGACSGSLRYQYIERLTEDGSIDTNLNGGEPVKRLVSGTGSRNLDRNNGLTALEVDGQSLIAVVSEENGRITTELFNDGGSAFDPFGGIVDVGFDGSDAREYSTYDLAVARRYGSLSTGFIVVGNESSSTTGNRAFVLAKLGIRGLDTSFGESGRLYQRHGAFERLLARDVEFDLNGRIVVAGYGEARGDDFSILYRYLANGDTDRSLSGGSVLDSDPDLRGGFNSIAIDSSNRIVAAGTAGNLENPLFIKIRRYLENGRRDVLFGRDGAVSTRRLPGPFSLHRELAVDSRNNILLAYWANSSSFHLIRFLEDGRPDASFGRAGEVGFSPSFADVRYVADVKIDDRNRIIVCAGLGTIDSSGRNIPAGFIVTRFLSTGRLDRSFGVGGVVRGRHHRGLVKSCDVNNRKVTIGATVVE